MAHCPYCGRELTKHERFCYHCEQDVSKTVDGAERPNLPKPKAYDLKKDFEDYKKLGKRILTKFKKTEKVPLITALCVKCNKKVNVKNPKQYTMKNNRIAVRGVCPFCSTKVFRIIGRKWFKPKVVRYFLNNDFLKDHTNSDSKIRGKKKKDYRASSAAVALIIENLKAMATSIKYIARTVMGGE